MGETRELTLGQLVYKTRVRLGPGFKETVEVSSVKVEVTIKKPDGSFETVLLDPKEFPSARSGYSYPSGHKP